MNINQPFIRKMDDYFRMVEDAFNNPVEIKWIDKKDHLIGLFTVNESVYQIDCKEYGNKIWKYDFFIVSIGKEGPTLNPNLTNYERDKYRVLPTIRSGMEHLYDLKSPDAIIYGALDDSKGRKKLYESFSKEFSKTKNWEFYTKVEKDKQIFVMYDGSIDMEYLFQTIKKAVYDKF